MAMTPEDLVNNIEAIYTPLLSGLSPNLSIPADLASLDLVPDLPEFTTVTVPDIPPITLGDLTTGETTLTGNGVFDILMKAVNKHLDSQFKKGAISQTEMSKLYVNAIEVALSQGVAFLVQTHQTAWAGENAKRQAQLLELQKAVVHQESLTKIFETVRAKMEVAKAQIDAYRAEGELVHIKVGIGATYQDILNKEVQQLLISEQVDTARANTKETLLDGAAVGGLVQQQIISATHQANLVKEQMETARAQTRETLSDGSPILGLVSTEKLLKAKQVDLLDEQIDSQRAQTKNTLVDGTTAVGGILGSQKSLYDQQKISYIHDSKNKAARLLTDAWTTQKTVDDGWTPPNAFLNAYIDPAIQSYISDVNGT